MWVSSRQNIPLTYGGTIWASSPTNDIFFPKHRLRRMSATAYHASALSYVSGTIRSPSRKKIPLTYGGTIWASSPTKKLLPKYNACGDRNLVAATCKTNYLISQVPLLTFLSRKVSPRRAYPPAPKRSQVPLLTFLSRKVSPRRAFPIVPPVPYSPSSAII